MREAFAEPLHDRGSIYRIFGGAPFAVSTPTLLKARSEYGVRSRKPRQRRGSSTSKRFSSFRAIGSDSRFEPSATLVETVRIDH
jgi:hypothetical protein